MKHIIYSRWSGEPQVEAEIGCAVDASDAVRLGLAVVWAVKNDANLTGATLNGATLTDANLTDANLTGANLNGANGVNDWIKFAQIERYAISYTADVIQIGCQIHTHAEWAAFTDAQIRAMDGKAALDWWGKYKDWLFATIARCPAQPTGYVAEGAAA